MYGCNRFFKKNFVCRTSITRGHNLNENQMCGYRAPLWNILFSLCIFSFFLSFQAFTTKFFFDIYFFFFNDRRSLMRIHEWIDTREMYFCNKTYSREFFFAKLFILFSLPRHCINVCIYIYLLLLSFVSDLMTLNERKNYFRIIFYLILYYYISDF